MLLPTIWQKKEKKKKAFAVSLSSTFTFVFHLSFTTLLTLPHNNVPYILDSGLQPFSFTAQFFSVVHPSTFHSLSSLNPTPDLSSLHIQYFSPMFLRSLRLTSCIYVSGCGDGGACLAPPIYLFIHSSTQPARYITIHWHANILTANSLIHPQSNAHTFTNPLSKKPTNPLHLCRTCRLTHPPHPFTHPPTPSINHSSVIPPVSLASLSRLSSPGRQAAKDREGEAGKKEK